MSFNRALVKKHAEWLAARGVLIGTSSWKYRGWCGQLYDESRYLWRGKFAEARFERDCLSEYAEVFKTVCVDAAYYTFPSERYLEGLAAQVPADFRFGLKVTDEITIRRFPNLPRFGARAGQSNERFLNADLFASAFLKPCESIRTKVGVLIFEFSRFYSTDYAHGREFLADLDRFLGTLPKGWPYAVELRNRPWLTPEYFACLARHGVTHVFNSWDAMPSVAAQMQLTGSRTNPELVAARFLLKPGRKYEDAVKAFQPYDGIKEVNQEARQAGADLIQEAVKAVARRLVLLFINNRLEGNALETIAAIIALALRDEHPEGLEPPNLPLSAAPEFRGELPL
ncbi:MAG TPA: DUF72 domain-containing protein [Verrucomicrobiota bacterium]|nr:DUF72 domain-containing protein [Verrucomicrobiota bacterium]